MCDPITIAIATALGAGSMLFGGDDAPAPPPPKVAAAPAPTAREADADVRIGDKAEDDNTADTDYSGFVEKRVSGKALGGLGKSGLGL